MYRLHQYIVPYDDFHLSYECRAAKNWREYSVNGAQLQIKFWTSSPTRIDGDFFSGILHDVYIMAMQKEILSQFVSGSPHFDPRLTGLHV
jgi:hypothetical protein